MQIELFVSRLPVETSVNSAIFHANPSVKKFYFLPTVSELFLNVPVNAISIVCKLLKCVHTTRP